MLVGNPPLYLETSPGIVVLFKKQPEYHLSPLTISIAFIYREAVTYHSPG
jgi:hypothetical protein